MAVDESHLEAGNVRGVDRGDRQQAARRVIVITQGRDQDGSSQREDRGIVLGNRRQSGGLDDLDADNAQRRRDAVGDRVGEGVGARRGGAEVDRAAVEVRRDRRARGCARDCGEAQRVAVGISVVLERVEGDRLTRVRLEQVAVRRRRQVSGLLDRRDELATRLCPLVVRDRQDDGLRAGCAAFIGDRQGTILAEGDTQALGCLRILEVDRVAIGVSPVAQHLVLNLRIRADLHGRCAQLVRRRVLAVGVNRHLHAGGRRGLPVGGLVGEGCRAGLIRIDAGDLQSAAAARDGDSPPRGRARRGRGQHVSVEVGVVVEDGQDRRAPRTDTEIVIHGLGRGVLLTLLRVGDLVRELGAVLLLLGFLELVLDLIPVVHEDHVRVGQPHAALRDVVEDDGLAVRAEDDVASGRERIDDHLLVRGGVVARTHVGARHAPRAVRAAFVANGGRGIAADAALGGGRNRRGSTRQRDRHEGRGCGKQDGIRLRSGQLQDAAFLDSGGAQVELLAARQEESVGLRVEGNDLVADDSHAQLSVLGDAVDPAGRSLIDAPLALNGRQRARGGQGVHGAVKPGHERTRAHVRGQGRSLGQVRGAGRGGRRGPQGAVGGVEDAEDVATLHRARTGGQSRRRAEGYLGDVNGSDSQGGKVRDGDGLARLADVEVGGLRAQGTVEDAGLVVEVTDHMLGLIGHPNATVVDVDLRDLSTLVDDACDAQRNNDQHQDKRR